MLTLLQRLDFWLTIAVLAFAAWLEFDKIQAWRKRRSVKRSERRQGIVMSRDTGSEIDRGGSQTSPSVLVRSQQDQVPEDWTASFEDVQKWVAEHNMTDEQAVILFATAHRQPDDFFLSANKIRDGVGGSRDAVLAQVAQCRPKPKPPRPSPRLERPKEGW